MVGADCASWTGLMFPIIYVVSGISIILHAIILHNNDDYFDKLKKMRKKDEHKCCGTEGMERYSAIVILLNAAMLGATIYNVTQRVCFDPFDQIMDTVIRAWIPLSLIDLVILIFLVCTGRGHFTDHDPDEVPSSPESKA